MQRPEDRSDLFAAASTEPHSCILLQLAFSRGQIQHSHRSNIHTESSSVTAKLKEGKGILTQDRTAHWDY